MPNVVTPDNGRIPPIEVPLWQRGIEGDLVYGFERLIEGVSRLGLKSPPTPLYETGDNGLAVSDELADRKRRHHDNRTPNNLKSREG